MEWLDKCENESPDPNPAETIQENSDQRVRQRSPASSPKHQMRQYLSKRYSHLVDLSPTVTSRHHVGPPACEILTADVKQLSCSASF